jgi:BolA protein
MAVAETSNALREGCNPRLAMHDDSHLHAGHAGAREGGHFTCANRQPASPDCHD